MIAPELAEIRTEAIAERIALEGPESVLTDWDFVPAVIPPETEEEIPWQ